MASTIVCVTLQGVAFAASDKALLLIVCYDVEVEVRGVLKGKAFGTEDGISNSVTLDRFCCIFSLLVRLASF